MDIFTKVYQDAEAIKAAEKAGDTEKLKAIDMSVASRCIRCQRICMDMRTGRSTAMRCSGCQAVIYCSRQCQVLDWKTPVIPRALPHKHYCPMNKEHMKRVPHFIAQLKQFPWGRLESDNTCSHELAKAMFDVLGSGKDFGYWSSRSDIRPHDKPPLDEEIPINSRQQMLSRMIVPRPYMHGEMLLEREWPTDEGAWVLKDTALIPRLRFSDDHPCPEEPKTEKMNSWKDWYEWRGLPLESPAALLMHYPLTVYHLLTKVLKVIKEDTSLFERQALEIHYVGAEVELNFIPLFSELALLLPNTDITLIMFGKPGCDLVKLAKRKHPKSLAKKDVVWSYSAPLDCGGGTIKVKIYAESEDWTREVVMGSSAPDAIVGLNAGLANYPGWGEPLMVASIEGIPFAATDYAEQSLQHFADQVPGIRKKYLAMTGAQSPMSVYLKRPNPMPVTVNPFHCPGQRGLPVTRLPSLENGFCMPVAQGNGGVTASMLTQMQNMGL